MAPLGITANIICPAAKSASFFRVMSEFPELIAAADAANPMGRMGDCEEDIGPVAVFLASEGSSYVTGNTLFVDGGPISMDRHGRQTWETSQKPS